MKAKPGGEKTGCTGSLTIKSDKGAEAEPEHWCLNLGFQMTQGPTLESKTNDVSQMHEKT